MSDRELSSKIRRIKLNLDRSFSFGTTAVLDSLWNNKENIMYRLIYDSKNACFIMGPEPTFGHEDYDSSLKQYSDKITTIKKRPKEIKEGFIDRVYDTWHSYIPYHDRDRSVKFNRNTFLKFLKLVETGTSSEVDRCSVLGDIYTLLYDCENNSYSIVKNEELIIKNKLTPKFLYAKAVSNALREWSTYIK